MKCLSHLDGVDLSVSDGEFTAIAGSYGSGKSTLPHMLGGLDRPTSGTVTVGGKDIFTLKNVYLPLVYGKAVMSYAFNVEDSLKGDMEAFMKNYTETVEPMMNYESKEVNGVNKTGAGLPAQKHQYDLQNSSNLIE